MLRIMQRSKTLGIMTGAAFRRPLRPKRQCQETRHCRLHPGEHDFAGYDAPVNQSRARVCHTQACRIVVRVRLGQLRPAAGEGPTTFRPAAAAQPLRAVADPFWSPKSTAFRMGV